MPIKMSYYVAVRPQPKYEKKLLAKLMNVQGFLINFANNN